MIRDFEISDLEEIDTWYQTHGKPDGCPFRYVPNIGVIEPGVAAGFLYKTDGYFAILENFITNPKAGPMKRNDAIYAIFEELLKRAKDFGFEEVYAITNVESVMQRAVNKGFSKVGVYSIYSREI